MECITNIESCHIYTFQNIVIYVAFLARDSTYALARYMSSPVRPSVCPSHG